MIRPLSLLLICCAATGCTPSGPVAVLRRETRVIDAAAIGTILRKAPVAESEDFHAETLLVSDEFSAHLLQFRTGEQRHIHQRHDLTILVHRGRGEIYINDRRRMAKPGSLFHVPRGTPHYCVNTGGEPLVAVNIFTPPYDLKDSLPMPIGTRSYERADEDR